VQTQPANTFAGAMADICCKESLLVTIEGGPRAFIYYSLRKSKTVSVVIDGLTTGCDCVKFTLPHARGTVFVPYLMKTCRVPHSDMS
jgi:hypothetical protein